MATNKRNVRGPTVLEMHDAKIREAVKWCAMVGATVWFGDSVVGVTWIEPTGPRQAEGLSLVQAVGRAWAGKSEPVVEQDQADKILGMVAGSECDD